jgi:hypothetical protein
MMNQRVWRSAVFAAVLAVLSLGSQAFGDDPTVFVTYRLNSWTVAPAITGQNVKGFLAYADDGVAVGSNITVIWYQLEGDGSWTTWAWPAYDLADATLYVRAILSDDSIFEEEPILSVQAWNTPSGHTPKEVINGLFFDDPIQPLVEGSATPEDLVTTLVDIGWQAAPDLSPLAVADPVVCEPGDPPKDPVKALMDVLAFKTEMRLFGASSFDLLCQSANCAGCERAYEGKTPVAGSTWVFHSRFLRPDNRWICYYDRDAVQKWRDEGETYIFCNQCTATGSISTQMHTETMSAVGDPDCHPPT